MTYFIMQLHFWLYTHKHVVNNYALPFLMGFLFVLVFFA
jgi:hypothetical protein